MKAQKIYLEIKNLDKKSKAFILALSKQKILKSQINNYSQSDKQKFLIFWNDYIIFFKKFQKTIKKSHYRKLLFFVDYNKFILQRYLVVLYFNMLADILKIFWEHEEFLRTFLDENIKFSYWKISKFLYKTHYISLLNTPDSLVKIQCIKVSKKYKKYAKIEKSVILNNRRIITDYKNIFFYLKRRVLKLLFIISKYSWKVIAATKFSSRTKWLITSKNLKKYLSIAEPWDIFLSRGNWNASNITIPWFWKHMSLYIGTGEFLQEKFWKQYTFLNKLKKKSHYIIEATGEWVKIEIIENLVAHNDYLWISRTKFSLEKINTSIQKSLSFYWKGYDHIFNFYSEKAVVCSELVLKSFWAMDKNDSSIELHLEKIWVSLTYPPNNFVSEIFDSSSQLDFVMFLDSIEKTWENFVSTKKEFKKSSSRSRFSFMLK